MYWAFLLQAAAPVLPAIPSALPTFTTGDGITGGGFALLAWLWNQERTRQQKYADDFKSIVQENTQAITKLDGSVDDLKDAIKDLKG